VEKEKMKQKNVGLGKRTDGTIQQVECACWEKKSVAGYEEKTRQRERHGGCAIVWV